MCRTYCFSRDVEPFSRLSTVLCGHFVTALKRLFVIECAVALRLFGSSVLRHVCRCHLLELRVKAVSYKPSRGVPALARWSVAAGQ